MYIKENAFEKKNAYGIMNTSMQLPYYNMGFSRCLLSLPTQMKLRETVQPLINKARGTHCEQCLSKKQLQVKLAIELEELSENFAQEYPDNEFDKVSGNLGNCKQYVIVFTILR